MKGHLSRDEVSRWMAVERGPDQGRHLLECPRCQAEVERLDAALAQFRGSLDEWSARQPNRWRSGRTVRVAARRPLRWALAATVFVLLTIPIYQAARDRQRAAADALLLQQVDAALSRSVPQPMEPLMKLVSWGPAPDGRKQDNRE